METLDIIRDAIEEWNGEDNKAVITCWRIAYVLAPLEPLSEDEFEQARNKLLKLIKDGVIEEE